MPFRFRFYLNFCLVVLLSCNLFSCTNFVIKPRALNTRLTDSTPADNAVKTQGGQKTQVQANEALAQKINEQESQYVLTSVGYAPIAAQNGDSRDLKMLNAIKVSKLEAYKEMAEQVYGVLLNAESNIISGRLQDDRVKSRVKGLVRGARVLKSYPRGDVYITELELDISHVPFF